MLEKVQAFIDPIAGVSLAALHATCCLNDTGVEITLPYALGEQKILWQENFAQYLEGKLGLVKPKIAIHTRYRAHKVHQGSPLPGIKNVILVGSGKGGVGKTSIALQFARQLQCQDAQVGILDADIYGPNILSLLDHEVEKQVGEAQWKPREIAGLSVISINAVSGAEGPMMWRGPMVSKAVMQLLTQTQWPKLDYLVIDLPPGTGDVQLSLSKQCPIAGSVMVTTPHPLAVLDTLKNIVMFQQMKVPILGIVENMSHYACPACGHESLEGSGGTHLSKVCELPLLAQIPIDERLAIPQADAISAKGLSQSLDKMTVQIAAKLAARGPEYRQLFSVKVKE